MEKMVSGALCKHTSVMLELPLYSGLPKAELNFYFLKCFCSPNCV